MSEVFVYIGTWTIKPGKEEEARKRMSEIVDFVEANEPRLIAFHMFFAEDGRTGTVVQVHPDCASMEYHMQVGAEHFASAFDWIDQIVSEQYYGTISDSLEAELSKWEEEDTSFTKMPDHENGFTRTTVR